MLSYVCQSYHQTIESYYSENQRKMDADLNFLTSEFLFVFHRMLQGVCCENWQRAGFPRNTRPAVEFFHQQEPAPGLLAHPCHTRKCVKTVKVVSLPEVQNKHKLFSSKHTRIHPQTLIPRLYHPLIHPQPTPLPPIHTLHNHTHTHTSSTTQPFFSFHAYNSSS